MNNKIITFFMSLKLTVILLVLSMVLVLAGTLAQVDQGIWTVVDQYFRSLIAWIDLPVFFPRTWNIPDIRIPFPGGFLLGWMLVLNLLAVHGAKFRIQAKGSRRTAGFLFLLLGILITVAVMQNWGTAPVAATDDDAFWRVFLRLGRGTTAAVVLYIACVLLYHNKAGMVLLHAGILFLMVGEFFTALFAIEATMTIKEGETVNYIDHSHRIELSISDTSGSDYDTVTVIPKSLLRNGSMLSPESLPFDLKIHAFLANSNRPKTLDSTSGELLEDYPEYQDYGSRLYIAELPAVSGAGARNAPAVDLELFDRETGAPLGRYILSFWMYPNFVNRAWDMPTRIMHDGREYELYLRFKREYLTSSSGHPYSFKLLDFVHEKYEGTQMPKDFSSRIVLTNPGDNVERELRIWMNNPLRYARRTFYQSGYLPNDSGTVLQVVRNDTWMIPYLSCMIVFAGMTAQFIQSLRSSQKNDA
jgi:hypothetical protein